MFSRYRPVWRICLALAFISLVGYLWPQSGPQEPMRVLLDNAGGPVVFEHAGHVAKDIDCITCHHANSPALAGKGGARGAKVAMPACGTCHGRKVNAAFAMAHQQELAPDPASCASCHHPAPATRDWGHKKHVQSHGLDCRDCHHKENEYIEEKPENCATCHHRGEKPLNRLDRTVFPGLADAVHARCASCHDNLFGPGFATGSNAGPGKAGKAGGKKPAGAKRPDTSAGQGAKAGQTSSCIVCHESRAEARARTAGLKNGMGLAAVQAGDGSGATAGHARVKSGPGTKAGSQHEACSTCHVEPLEKLLPGRMDAFHSMCMGCHARLGKGPYKAAESTAGQGNAAENVAAEQAGNGSQSGQGGGLPGQASCVQCHTGK